MNKSVKHMTNEEKTDYGRMHVQAALSCIGQKNGEENIKCRLDSAMVYLNRALGEFDEKKKEEKENAIKKREE